MRWTTAIFTALIIMGVVGCATLQSSPDSAQQLSAEDIAYADEQPLFTIQSQWPQTSVRKALDYLYNRINVLQGASNVVADIEVSGGLLTVDITDFFYYDIGLTTAAVQSAVGGTIAALSNSLDIVAFDGEIDPFYIADTNKIVYTNDQINLGYGVGFLYQDASSNFSWEAESDPIYSASDWFTVGSNEVVFTNARIDIGYGIGYLYMDAASNMTWQVPTNYYTIAEVDALVADATNDLWAATTNWTTIFVAAATNDLIHWVPAPGAVGDPGVAGDAAYDADHLYICVGADDWRRTTLATWE